MSCRNGTCWYSDDDPGLGLRLALGRRPSGQPGAQLGDVLGRRAAAAADERQPELAGERLVGVRQLLRGERVVGAVGGQLGQPGVRHAGQRDPRVRGQVAQVLAHLGRPGGAVQADQVDAERLQRGQRGADLAAEQHRAGGLDGHLADQRHVARSTSAIARCAPMIAAFACSRSWQVSTISASAPPASSPAALQLVGVAQLGEGDVAERRQLGARADRAEHPARPPVGCRRVGDLAGQLRAGLRTARGSGRRCRTRRGCRGWRRTCWSRRSRRRRRSTRRGSAGRRRAGSR